MARSTVLLIVIALLLAATIGAAATVASLRGGEKQLPDGSPERAVQLYLNAIEDRDATAALAHLSPSLTARCGEIPRDMITARSEGSLRATLDDVRLDGNAATVRIQLTETFGGAPFGVSDPKQTLVFELERVNEEWRFSQMPWPLYCPFKPS